MFLMYYLTFMTGIMYIVQCWLQYIAEILLIFREFNIRRFSKALEINEFVNKFAHNRKIMWKLFYSTMCSLENSYRFLLPDTGSVH